MQLNKKGGRIRPSHIESTGLFSQGISQSNEIVGKNEPFMQTQQPTQISVRMYGKYHVYDSVLSEIKKIITNNLVYPSSQIPRYWKNAWSNGILIKEQGKFMSKTFDDIVTESGFFPTNLHDHVKIDILRIFFTKDLLHTKNDMFAPICIRNTTDRVKFGGGKIADIKSKLIDDDERRSVTTISFSELQPLGSPVLSLDKKYVIKLSKQEKYKQAYQDEASVYKYTHQHYDKDLVKYFNSGFLTSADSQIIIDEQQVNVKDIGLTNENGFYIVLENACDFYDYDDYLEIVRESKQSFQKIYTSISQINKEIGFIHGDFHFGNIKINKQLQIKLFDFDFSGVINKKNDDLLKKYY